VADEQATGLAGTVRLLPRYTSVSVGASSDANNRSYSGTTSGGVVLHSDGVTFSPYPVQDTFALVDVSGLSGVRIDTPEGPVWTDWKGSAVAAYMPPYYEDKLELTTKHLPRNVDVQNGVQVSKPGRGSVSVQRFSVVTNRRVLLHVRMAAGGYVSKGEAVLDDQDGYVATVGAEGSVFISDEALLKRGLYIRSNSSQSCQLQFNLPERAPSDELYEELDGVCQQASQALPLSPSNSVEKK
jgi:outer membrane usher protein FimD/PapC